MTSRLLAPWPRRSRHLLLLGVLLAGSSLCAQTLSKNPLERKLQFVMVPKVDFKDASLDGVLDFMAKAPVDTKQMENPVNIVKAYKSTDPDLGDTRVTLSLSNVPWTEVLRYVCLSANVQVAYESHAIVIRAPSPPSTASPTP